MGNYATYLVLLFICVFSRLISAIYYIEDPDSLSFALCVIDQYDPASFQSYFSAYSVFCLLAKPLYFILGNFSITFSLIGGIALFFIIFYILKLLSLPILSLEGVLIALFIFFNPMIWIMSNRFMPDLAGIAVMIAAFYYLVPDTHREKDVYLGWLLAGILAGLKPSFLLFLIIPAVYAFFSKKKYLLSVLSLLAGIFVWLLPIIIATGGIYSLINIVREQSNVLLHDFSTSIFTQEYSWSLRFLRVFQSIWADGLGGFWIDRNFALLFNSAGIIACLVFGFLILLNFNYPKSKILVLISSCFLYLLWVLLFQEIGSSGRYVLPVIPFLCILIAYGIIYFLVNFNYLFVKVLMLVFLFSTIFLTVVLTVQHTYPTAIAQVKEHLINKSVTEDKFTILSTPSINNFLKAQNINANFVSVKKDSLSFSYNKTRVFPGRLIVISDSEVLLNRKPLNFIHFQHNPYVNKVWPDLRLYEYSRPE